MPTYEYECLQCGGRFQVRRGIADNPSAAPCPECRGRKTRQILTGGRKVPRGRTSGARGSSSSCGSCTRSSCAGCGG